MSSLDCITFDRRTDHAVQLFPGAVCVTSGRRAVSGKGNPRLIINGSKPVEIGISTYDKHGSLADSGIVISLPPGHQIARYLHEDLPERAEILSSIAKYFEGWRNYRVAMRTRTVSMALLIGLVTLPPVFLWQTRNSLKRFEGLHTGDAVPFAKVQTSFGKTFETSSWLGTPTLLVVFNPGCRPCQQEIRNLSSVAPKFPDVKIALLSTKTDVGAFQASFPIYVDREGILLARVQRLVTPALYWIGASGTVRYARIGERDAADEEILLRRLQALEK